ncbi:Type I restriction modification DNA specificity domain protein [Paraprevotella clara]|uniref:Type I restriction modification DNA specificity domain protein n=2 Tax=Paraprevotella clara TaxID=454154 RepID=A0A6N3EZQ9_9BACT
MRFPEFSGEWKKMTLEHVTDFVKERISTDILTLANYVSTENMKSDFGGITPAISIPNNTNVIHYHKDDVLLSNIRPYLRKVWAANGDGGCSADVFVFRAKSIFPSFLYCIMANDTFINYVMSGAKGVKMPRGDKEQMLKYVFSIPSIEEQSKISRLLHLLDERIATQNKIIEDLKKLNSAIIDRLYENVDGQYYLYGDLLTVVNKKNKTMEYSNVLSASQEFGMIERNDLNIDIKYEKSAITGYKIVREGDYVVHLRSFQGGMAFSQMVGVCSPAYIILRPNDRLSYGYLAPYFTSTSFINSLRLVTYGIRDGRSINVDEWLNMKVRIPSLEVQRHILSIIKIIECKLLNEIRIAEKLLKQRSHLLSQMFI